MKVLFAGTPDIAVPSLVRLAEKHTVAGVLTAPDTRKGRGKKLVYNPVKEKALELGLPVLQPHTLRSEARREIAPLGAELLAVFAYGKIFGPRFLALFPRGGINVHPSLLPRYRGSIPLIAPIVNGDAETGVCVQRIALEMDAGDILSVQRRSLDGSETAGSLSEWAADTGAEMMGAAVDAIAAGQDRGEPQRGEEAVYCRRLGKSDGKINWSLPAPMIARSVRGFNPWPKAFTFWKEQRLNILAAEAVKEDAQEEAVSEGRSASSAPAPYGTVVGMDRERGILVQTGSGLLALQSLQLQSKRPAEWSAFLNGNRDFIGSRLGEHT
jgi:methionyl-tRNA formyltransferase